MRLMPIIFVALPINYFLPGFLVRSQILIVVLCLLATKATTAYEVENHHSDYDGQGDAGASSSLHITTAAS